MADPSTRDAIADHLALRVGSGDDPGDEAVTALVDSLQSKFRGELCAVLLYGSYLRGARDTLLDFYVVVDDYRRAFGAYLPAVGAFLMPPNVYQLAITRCDRELRAKYAVVSRAQLRRQVVSVHPYFWARLTQPSRLVYARDADARAALIDLLATSVQTFVKRVAPVMSGSFTSAEFWSRGFALTYRAELRAEKSGRVSSLYGHEPDYYDALLEICAAGDTLQSDSSLSEKGYRVRGSAAAGWAGLYWTWTTALGKVLSVLRLVKGAVTFNDPIDYMLWKVERHSGIQMEATPRQRKYPLIFAWPLAWRLYRLGAFR